MSGMSMSTTPEGQWLRTTRQSKGLYQHQLAALIDENQGRISEIETGVRIWTPTLRKRLEEALGVKFKDDKPTQ